MGLKCPLLLLGLVSCVLASPSEVAASLGRRRLASLHRRGGAVFSSKTEADLIIYPEPGWGLQKPLPKASLGQPLYAGEEPKAALKRVASARAWILNVVELLHWVSFPIGFGLFYVMFRQASGLDAFAGGGQVGVFFLMLAHLSQTFGGGISGNMMHQYEGWQVAPFRSPLVSPQQDPLKFNNAWLRAVAYQMLFSFQTLGVLCFTVGVYGLRAQTLALAAATGLLVALGPELPHATLSVNGQPVFPLPIGLFVAFIANALAATAAYYTLFGQIQWPLPDKLRALRLLLPVLPFLLVAGGGIFEGLVAESSFNQWHHFIAFVLLDLGLLLHIPYYLQLIK